jgi:hypothetical protein
MKIADLDSAKLRRQLRDPGVLFRLGPFLIRFRTSIEHVVAPFGLLYSDYALAEDSQFSDFRVRIVHARRFRRWIWPRAVLIFDGRPTFTPFPSRMSFAYFEWGLNWCIANRCAQYLIFHAAVLERSGRAILLPGPPGSGKSTLCAAMTSRGWRLLSDELTLVRTSDGLVVPMPRPISLKNQSIRVIRELAGDTILGPPFPTPRKGEIAHVKPPRSSVALADAPALPAWVVFPTYVDGSETNLSPLAKSRALLRLADSSFNYGVLGTEGFESTRRLIDGCQCFEIKYGDLGGALAQIAVISGCS